MRDCGERVRSVIVTRIYRRGREPVMIAGVLFDSGDVLMAPAYGSWFHKPRFAELIEVHGLVMPEGEAVRSALDSGMDYLDDQHLLTGLHHEMEQYVEYYRIVLDELFEDYPAPLVRELASAAVYENDQTPFADVEAVLVQLRRAGMRLGVVSNAGPSLELRYRRTGLRGLFDVFIISAVVGVSKPDREIYELALGQLGLSASSVALVDDDADNVEVAIQMGMHGLVMDRYGTAPRTRDLPIVRDLTGFVSEIGIGGS